MGVSKQIILFSLDETIVRKVSSGLEISEYKLIVAKTKEEVLETVAIGVPTLYMIDATIGADDFIALCSAIRAPELNLIGIIAIIGGYTDVLSELLNATVDDVLIQPFTGFSLMARIHAQFQRISISEQLDFKVRDSWTLIDITSKLVGTGDLLYSLYDMVSILSVELNSDRCSVVLVRDEGDLGLVIASSDDPDIQNLVINLESYPEIGRVVNDKEPLIVSDVSDSKVMEGVLPTLQSVQVRSIALFPIIEENRVLGVIFLRYEHTREVFSQRELVFCQTVANATAIALRNHEITQSLHKKNMQIEKVQTEAESKLAALVPYEKFFMGFMDGLLVIDSSGVVVFVNPEGTSILGFNPGEIRGMPFENLIPFSQKFVYEHLVEKTESGQKVSVEFELDNSTSSINGDSKIISASAVLLGEEGMILITLRDITEDRMIAKRLVEAQQQLIKSEKHTAIMEIAGAAAHELNQPLTVVLTSIAMFKRLLVNMENSPLKLLDTMEQELDRMTAIIKKLSRLTDYSTKEYVGDAKIIDLDRSSSE
ncbi:MAG: GAF domain-containing protein [Deltaproteobacteria bacterium]|nr:GAF domain-containing protein [Deltaproteobacteria bacterium]